MDAIKGRIFLFGDNVDTDQIYPGRYIELTEHDEIATHVMEGADPSFASNVKPGDIIIAGTNFGCGSSREHAVIALKNAKVGAVVAKSFARIFFRNAINQGFIVVEAPDLDELDIQEGDQGILDFLKGQLLTDRGKVAFLPFSQDVLEIIEAGGIFRLFKDKGIKVWG